jgi:hypothetical protein
MNPLKRLPNVAPRAALTGCGGQGFGGVPFVGHESFETGQCSRQSLACARSSYQLASAEPTDTWIRVAGAHQTSIYYGHLECVLCLLHDRQHPPAGGKYFAASACAIPTGVSCQTKASHSFSLSMHMPCRTHASSNKPLVALVRSDIRCSCLALP